MKGTARSLVYFKVMEQLIEALKNKCDYGSTKDIKLLSKWILNLADNYYDQYTSQISPNFHHNTTFHMNYIMSNERIQSKIERG